MKTIKVIIDEDNRDFFRQIKEACDELSLPSFPTSREEYSALESGLKEFIGDEQAHTILYIINVRVVNDKIDDRFYTSYAKGRKTLFLFGLRKNKKRYMEQIVQWCDDHPECSFTEKGAYTFHSNITSKIRNILKAKVGFFILNSKRCSVPTNDTMYDCNDCLQNKVEHKIITIPGPPSEGGQTSYRGEATTLRECTGCGAQDGPWVMAQC
ncbi:MAG: hypothetical protein ABIO57_03455 [Candidatus Paceibacterota bacterium]